MTKRMVLGAMLALLVLFPGGTPVFRAQASIMRVTASIIEGYEPCGISLRRTTPGDGEVSREVAERVVRGGRPFDYVAHGNATVGITFADAAGNAQPIVGRPSWVFASYNNDFVALGPRRDSRPRKGAFVTIVDSRTGRSVAEWLCTPPQTVSRDA